MVSPRRPSGLSFVCIVIVAVAFIHAATRIEAFEVVEASLSGKELAFKVVVFSQEARVVEENRVQTVNGRQVVETVTVEKVFRVPVMEERVASIDDFLATDAAGRPIERDRLAEILRKPTLVVTGSVMENQRRIFREGTVFLESTRNGDDSP